MTELHGPKSPPIVTAPPKRYDNGLPIIRLEVESMKLSIIHAFTEMQGSMDADIHAAVEEFCRPENITGIIRRQTSRTIEQAIKEEVERFYRTGKGRQAVREAVDQALGETP